MLGVDDSNVSQENWGHVLKCNAFKEEEQGTWHHDYVSIRESHGSVLDLHLLNLLVILRERKDELSVFVIFTLTCIRIAQKCRHRFA